MIYISQVLLFILFNLKFKYSSKVGKIGIKILIQQTRKLRLRFSDSTRWPWKTGRLPIQVFLFFSHTNPCLQGGNLPLAPHPLSHTHTLTLTHLHTQQYCTSGHEGGKDRMLMDFIIRENHTQLIVNKTPFMEELIFYCMTFINCLLCAS